MDKRIQQTLGTKLGDFEVINYSQDKHQYLCRCLFCGEEKFLPKNRFKYKGSITCKCTKSGVKKGDSYFQLTAKERDISRIGEGRVFWLWECSCGNIISAPLRDVKSGNTKSCGCLNQKLRNERIANLNKNLEDLSNQRFTKLLVKRLATEEEKINRPMGNRYWFCECDCGNTHIVSTSDLKSGKVKSCGCLLSLGEEIISKMLRDNNIPFKTQYTFPDLKGTNNHLYRFDFAVFNENGIEYLIEFDGIQHYKENQQFGDNSESFLKIQERDRNKNMYCIKNSIPLIRIPYTHLSNLIIDDLILSKTTYLWKE